ncbi:hypothetical protein B0H13DRAFT_1854823 [Mycena leptocephala]|nr:hypothetical protein B0H13DRAFT_1854823 [Mycena leptocephala]
MYESLAAGLLRVIIYASRIDLNETFGLHEILARTLPGSTVYFTVLSELEGPLRAVEYTLDDSEFQMFSIYESFRSLVHLARERIAWPAYTYIGPGGRCKECAKSFTTFLALIALKCFRHPAEAFIPRHGTQSCSKLKDLPIAATPMDRGSLAMKQVKPDPKPPEMGGTHCLPVSTVICGPRADGQAGTALWTGDAFPGQGNNPPLPPPMWAETTICLDVFRGGRQEGKRGFIHTVNEIPDYSKLGAGTDVSVVFIRTALPGAKRWIIQDGIIWKIQKLVSELRRPYCAASHDKVQHGYRPGPYTFKRELIFPANSSSEVAVRSVRSEEPRRRSTVDKFMVKIKLRDNLFDLQLCGAANL